MYRKNTLLLLFAFMAFCTKSNAQCPPNIDFEDGTFTNWTCYIANTYSGSLTLTPGIIPTLTPPTNGRHNITTGAGTDYYGGFPVVGAGGYSARIGYDTNGLRMERIRYYVDVPTGTARFALVYRYAIVLEAPGSHSATEMPKFQVTASDSVTGLPEPCGSYTYVSTVGGLPGFVLSGVSARDGGGTDVYYRPWNTATLNLSGLGGTTVAIDFAVADCSLGGHFGYAYVDMSCGLFEVQGVTCNDTATHITLSAPFGYEYYTWYDSATFTIIYGSTQTITIPVPPGAMTYAVVLTPYSGYGCPDTLYTHIAPTRLAVNPMHDTLICNGDSVTLNSGATDVALPLTYSWTGPGLSCTSCATPTAHPAVGTNVYSVEVTNTVGCTKDTFIIVTVDYLNASLSKFDDTCHQGTVGWAKATATSTTLPITYLWSSTYPVTTTQTTATAVGLSGNGYGASPNDSIFYTVVITDGGGCSTTDSIAVKDGQPTDLYIDSISHPDSCNIANGYIILDSLVPLQTFKVSYLFTPPGGTAIPQFQNLTANALWQVKMINLPQGIYNNITITDISIRKPHCPYNVVGPVTLHDPPIPSAPGMGSNSPACYGTPIVLTALSNPGANYSWTATTGFNTTVQDPIIPFATFGDSGLYTVVVDLVNCFDSNKIRVWVKPTPIPSASNSSPVCSGGNLLLNSSSSNGATYYVWNGPNGYYSNSENPTIGNVPVLAAGVYTVTVVLNGCVDTISTTVVINQTPDAPIVSDTEYCQNGVAAPFSFSTVGTDLKWYTTATGGTGTSVVPTPSTLQEGTVTWYVTQTSSTLPPCESPRAPITAKIDYLATPSIGLTDSVTCLSSDVTFNALNTGDDMTGLSWSFSDGHNLDNVNPIIHAFDGTGTFTVTATALYKVCPTETVTRTVVIFPVPSVYLGADTSICPGGEAIVIGDYNNENSPSAKWLWSTGSTQPRISVTTPGTYYVKVSIDGCAASDTIVVARDCYLDLPNVFTPNGDGLNDYFFPRDLLTRGLTSFNMQIYNRWGQEVFSTVSLDGRGWDGRFNNVAQPEGVYVYIIEATFKDGQKERHQGNITLLR